eukprot:TRINITY_DN11696_c0_g1_i1.p1 TRINITY_DN11696_c0_g1~~TRINITY_DN11696_c0_g1_i1.p1  ORF type:complete len:499 (+),score=87.62 TRINITY_DN11696_c0_g1_i1:38-1534(+)
MRQLMRLGKHAGGYQVSAWRYQSTAPKAQVVTSHEEQLSYVGPDYESAKQIRKTNLSPAMLTYYSEPLLIHKGKMQWLWDHSGKKYLDMFGGIVTVSVGHCHPKVNEALHNQIDKLWHTTNIYMHPTVHEYAHKLAQKMPGNLKNVYFVNSGSEANDLAMFMARLYTGNHDILGFRNAYHGMSPYTMGLTAHSTWKFSVPTGMGVHHIMNPDVYRGLWGHPGCRDCPVLPQGYEVCNEGEGECASAVDNYMEQFEEVVRYSLPKGKSVAAFFAESIQGVGGSVQYPKGYLKRAFARTRELGGVCISDEVQTGFGRTGEHFWGFQGHGVMPDIVTMAKGIGNGFPMAAVVTTPEIAATMSQALHFNTFGGNPMAGAVGIKVLEVMDEEKTQENSDVVGTYLLNKLVQLVDKYEIVGDVRGKGLMIGIEMVEDKSSKKPLNGDAMMKIWDKTKEGGVLIGKGGHFGQVFRMKPPMCITQADADLTLQVIEDAIDQVNKQM